MRSLIQTVLLCIVAAALVGCAGAASQVPATAAGQPSPVRATPSLAVADAGAEQKQTRPVLDLVSLEGRVVFSRGGDVYVINADGSDSLRLTNDPAPDFDPVWSPDGTQIAFRSHRDGNEEVYVMAADGTAQRNLSQALGADYSPSWSPDGAWIAFQSDRSGNPSIWLIRPDGSQLRQVTSIAGISEYPTWSPDSARLAFHCTFGRVLPQGVGDFEICVVNIDGSGLTQVTDAPGESKLPAWSPEGSTIAFQSNRHGWPSLPDCVPPAYEAERFGEFDIYVMNSDGSDLLNLTNNPHEDDTEPAWSRDGQLVFTRYGCLMVMNTDRSVVSQLVAGAECDSHFPDWYQPIQ